MALPGLAIDNRLVLAQIARTLVRDFAYIEGISRSLIVGTAGARQRWRVPAREIEEAIAGGIADLLDERATIASTTEEVGILVDL